MLSFTFFFYFGLFTVFLFMFSSFFLFVLFLFGCFRNLHWTRVEELNRVFCFGFDCPPFPGLKLLSCHGVSFLLLCNHNRIIRINHFQRANNAKVGVVTPEEIDLLRLCHSLSKTWTWKLHPFSGGRWIEISFSLSFSNKSNLDTLLGKAHLTKGAGI